jgi:predicted nuclease of predicted toxin-antitoxin system
VNILIDECIDRRLVRQLSGHNVKTVPQMGWAGIRDRELLRLAETEFDILITVDRNLQFQQNLAILDLAIVETVPKGKATVVS